VSFGARNAAIPLREPRNVGECLKRSPRSATLAACRTKPSACMQPRDRKHPGVSAGFPWIRMRTSRDAIHVRLARSRRQWEMSTGKPLSHQQLLQRPGSSPGLSFLPRLGFTADQLVGGDGPRPLTTEYPRWKQRSSAARGVTRACVRIRCARRDGVCCARTDFGEEWRRGVATPLGQLRAQG
jgi:hypothetical protein